VRDMSALLSSCSEAVRLQLPLRLMEVEDRVTATAQTCAEAVKVRGHLVLRSTVSVVACAEAVKVRGPVVLRSTVSLIMLLLCMHRGSQSKGLCRTTGL
jgi:hypothetical protein